MRRKIGIMLEVALLVAGLAAPASAKKGGHPGAPSGTGLEVTVEPSGSFMWANSVGDKILFDITVTNTSGGKLSVEVDFSDELLKSFDLAKNESWSEEYTYTVVEGDFTDSTGSPLPISTRTDVTVGTVTAAAAGDISDSDDAVMTAYPVKGCVVGQYGVVYFGPNEEYSECSFTAGPAELWTMETTLAKPPHGKRLTQGATVRDGIPGNWCTKGDPTYDEEAKTVTETVYFPTAVDGNIVCEQGGAGGDTIPVRNANTFYLATWTDNVVTLTPPTP